MHNLGVDEWMVSAGMTVYVDARTLITASWQTAAILKMVLSLYLSWISSDFKKI